MKKQSVFILGFIALILVAIGYFGFSKKNNQAANSSNESSSATQQSTYTLSQVATHNTSSNCWMAINGKVYDFTSYIPQHPNNDIVRGCGKDATSMYQEIIKHQIRANRMLPDYVIGNLAN